MLWVLLRIHPLLRRMGGQTQLFHIRHQLPPLLLLLLLLFVNYIIITQKQKTTTWFFLSLVFSALSTLEAVDFQIYWNSSDRNTKKIDFDFCALSPELEF